MRYTKPIGVTAVVIGGVAAIVSPLLRYMLGTSVWQLTTRYPLVITALVAAAMALAVTSLAVDRWLLLAFAGLISGLGAARTRRVHCAPVRSCAPGPSVRKPTGTDGASLAGERDTGRGASRAEQPAAPRATVISTTTPMIR